MITCEVPNKWQTALYNIFLGGPICWVIAVPAIIYLVYKALNENNNS